MQLSTNTQATKRTAKERTFRLLSLLFQYPGDGWVTYPQLRRELEELEDPLAAKELQEFLRFIKDKEELELAEFYVETFDFNPQTNLYMTHHTLGEDRKRGQALAEMKGIYAKYGYELATEELSDYLPVILEFLSVAPEAGAREILDKVRQGMENLRTQLEQAANPYAGVARASLLAVDFKEVAV